MSTVKVNLLPREHAEETRARRVSRLSYTALGVVVLALGGVYANEWNNVRVAEQDRDDAEAEVARLEAELAELEEYRQIAEMLEAREATLAAAMSDEIAWARILNDLSLAFPSDASLESLSATATEPPELAEGDLDPGDPVGEVTVTGYSIERYAPGVESVLIDFEGARGFFNSFLQTASAEDRADSEITNFNGTINLDDDALTDRYVDGLPAEVDQ